MPVNDSGVQPPEPHTEAEGPAIPATAVAERPLWSDSSDSDEPVFGHRGRTRLAWFLGGIAVLILLLILPPLLNVSRYQRRVAQSISQAIGRPVHFDSITAHLLPWPGFTIQNFVVNEDPAFGAEPAMRANVVEARLRVRSLWRRRVEFARIKLQAPSVNLVRRADGVWNLQSIVTQAGAVQNAPTAAKYTGAAPRFPYVEATGARVNIKLQEAKLPYSLVDTDFALWLPNEREWHLRLAGRPLRTDTDVSDVGELHMDGTLGRGTGSAAEAPLELRADWKPTPMGETAKLFVGHDAGWRGGASAEMTIHGTPAAMQISADLHVHDLRRAEFVPAAEMQLDAHCEAQAMGVLHQVHGLHCTLPTRTSGSLLDSFHLLRNPAPGPISPEPSANPTEAEEPDRTAHVRLGNGAVPQTVVTESAPVIAQSAPGILELTAEMPNAMDPTSISAELVLQHASPAWGLNWMRLFSQRIAPGLAAGGDLSLQFRKLPGQPHDWSGTILCQCSLPPESPKAEQAVPGQPEGQTNNQASGTVELARAAAWQLSAEAGGVHGPGEMGLHVTAQRIDPVPPAPPAHDGHAVAGTAATLMQASGEISGGGYLLRYGSAAMARYAAQLLPPLGDGIPQGATGPVQTERAWGGSPSWTAMPVASPAGVKRHRRSRR